MNAQTRSAEAQSLLRHWRGLGAWNYYFLIKFALLWYGYLNFHALTNLIFLAALLFPLPSLRLHRLRHWLALPFGIALFYHDTWLPGPDSILSMGAQWSNFSGAYMLELADRFINWQMIGIAFVLLIAYLFVSQWLRLSLFTVVAMIWLNLLTIGGPAFSLQPSATAQVISPVTPGDTAQPAIGGPPNNDNLNAYLAQFLNNEKGRMTEFPQSLPADAQPFDLLMLNVCSLSWSDIEAVQLTNHPLWRKFDILFKEFNSATAYSGPAAIRLLRASCGQPPHRELYQPTPRQCYLFDNLAQLGFTPQLVLDHSGQFGNYLNNLRQYANMQAEPLPKDGIGHRLTSFNGEPIYDDLELLDRWLKQLPPADQRVATFMNLIPLHDGNRLVGTSSSAEYGARARKLFDELNRFLDQLQQSGRKVMVVLVPEHGAAVAGDKMQMSGLRDIPSPSITHTPVGIAFIGMQAPQPASPVEIAAPSSYLAISELVARVVDGKLFSAPSVDWQALTQDLPQTAAVSENDDAIVVKYQGKAYIQLNQGDWVPYPQ